MGGSGSSLISSQIISLINNSYSSSQVVCPSSDGDLSPTDEYVLGVGFVSMISLTQNAAARSLGSFVLASYWHHWTRR